MKKGNGDWLIAQMEETGVSIDHLTWGMSVARRTVQYWREGSTLPSRKKRQEIDAFFSARREYLKGGNPHPHPHRGFLHRLKQAVEAGSSCEVLGLPGMLKTEMLSDLYRRLKRNNGESSQVFFYNLGSESDISGFWNSVGRKVIGDGKRSFTFEDVQEAMEKKAWTLLLDDADLFLSNVERRYSGRPYDFGPVGSQWIKNVLGLHCSKILTSTIASADFVALVAGGSPCHFMEYELKQWHNEKGPKGSDWNFWTAVQVDNVRNGAKKIKVRAKGIPLLFHEGIKSLKPHLYANVNQAMGQIQSGIARSIWHRLPAKNRDELKRNNFELSSESRLYKAFLKSGITINETGPLQKSLRVPSWLETWKMEARAT